MGVLRLFRWIVKKFKNQAILSLCKNNYKKEYHVKGGKYYKPDILLIDCNAIFHPACRSIFDPEMRSLLNPKIETEQEKKLRAFKAVCLEIEKIIEVSCPKKAVYLAIDGVAGCCKQAQQRKRRFKTANDIISKGEGWDSSVLTVGTSFMKELCDYIRLFFSINIINRPKHIQNLRFIFNDMNVPGEGEHKLIRFIEMDRQYYSYSIYSPDADLIMLGMLIPKKYVTILRENIYKEEPADYFVVNMSRLKEAFLNEIHRIHLLNLNTIDNLSEETNNAIIADVVLFLFMLGNDFLPHVPCLDIVSNGIEILLNCYTSCIIKKGSLIYSSGKNEGQFNKESLQLLFNILKELEPSLLYKKYKDIKSPIADSVIVSSLINNNEEIDYKIYRKNYYKRNFGIEEEDAISRVCDEYMRGMRFVIEYYTKCIPTFDWYYPYHYAPLFSDLESFVINYDIEYTFKYKPPLSQIEALVSVLHPCNFGLIPDVEVSKFMIQRSQIDSNFPTEFSIDLEGKLQEYEGIILLPMVNYDIIKKMLKKFNIKDPIGKVVNLTN
jgi:5'-3' exonuclease